MSDANGGSRDLAARLHDRALDVRLRLALEIVGSLEVEQRVSLLAAVVWPGRELAEISLDRAMHEVADEMPAPRRPRAGQTCVGCGCELDENTLGCGTCTRRQIKRRLRREQQVA